MEFGEKLRNIRLKKGLKQSDVAAVLECAPTSITNYENGFSQPPVETLGRLCEVLEISPLDLLSKEYSFDEIVAISQKPAYDRTYEEKIALNFSANIIEKLIPVELQLQESLKTEKRYSFINDNNLLERFGGQLTGNQIETLMDEYEQFGNSDNDILFAYHILTFANKKAVLDMLCGMINNTDNIQNLTDDINTAVNYTLDKLKEERISI